MTQAEQVSALQTKLEDKTQEILKLVANTYGVEDVASLDAIQCQRLNEESEVLLHQNDEAVFESDSAKLAALSMRSWRKLKSVDCCKSATRLRNRYSTPKNQTWASGLRKLGKGLSRKPVPISLAGSARPVSPLSASGCNLALRGGT